VLSALVVPEEEAATIKSRLGAFLSVAEKITDAPVKEKLLHLVEDTPANLLLRVDTARAEFDKWFSSAQDRAQQWFQVHTRALTIVASVLVALVLQLDAVEIFHHVSTNAASRAALVATVDQVVNQAERVLADEGGLIRRIADRWLAQTAESDAVDLAQVRNVDELKAKLQQAKPDLNEAAFDAVVRETTDAYFKEKRQELTGLTTAVSGSGFQFIPVGYWRWPSPNGPVQSAKNIIRHLPGIAIFAALLTLGAPYWYNLLKNLASLRPAVAQVISREERLRSETKT
ncbi:MAG TPA: hypothetical protein VG095_05795, partial [Chthoniobacterales bacterium]|nr:hypothetical protein [Chthoniobacterales bacterium]